MIFTVHITIKHVILFLTILYACLQASGQKPDWLVEKPQSEKYIYIIGRGTGSPAQKVEAIRKAVDGAIEEYNELGATFILSSETKTSTSNITDGTNAVTEEYYKREGTIRKTGKKIKVSLRRIGQPYYENNTWEILVRIPNNVQVINNLENEFTYNKSNIWKSAVYPGWGQMYAGQKKKGMSLLVTETCLLTGLFVSSYYTSYNNTKAYDTYNKYERQDFLDKEDAWKKTATVFGIAAGAVYVFNLIDALASKGKKEYAFIDYKRIQMDLSCNNYIELKFCVNF